MERLCPDCLPGYLNKTIEIVQETKSFEISNELLSMVGQSMGRGKFIGPGQKLQPSGLTPEPPPDEDHGSMTRGKIEPDNDDDDFPTGDKTPIRWLLNVPRRDLVSSETLQRHYGASEEEAAHVLAQIDEIPAIYVAAIEALGWTEEAWLDSEIQRLLAEYRLRQAVLGVTEIPLNRHKTCSCGADFIPSKPWHKYCSDRCSNRFRVAAYRKRLKQELVTA
jgi:hypothetical protein